MSAVHVGDYSGTLANFPLDRVGSENARYRGSRGGRTILADRRSSAEYEISGSHTNAHFPYVSGVPSLREAISIGRLYPGIYGDGAATHIVRRFVCRGLEDHVVTGLTHRWRVFPDGRIELLVIHAHVRPNKAAALGYRAWLKRLESPPAFTRDHVIGSGKPFATELSDLFDVAMKFGYSHAADALRPLIADANLWNFPLTVQRGTPEQAPRAEGTSSAKGASQRETRPLSRASRWVRSVATSL
jgi:hypothetical protein